MGMAVQKDLLLINKLRESSGVSPLATDDGLDLAAAKHAMTLAHANSSNMEHGDIIARLRRQGVGHTLVGQLVGEGETVEQVAAAWTDNVKDHSILCGPFSHGALAYSVSSDNKKYWVLIMVELMPEYVA